ncbi:MAG: leukotoxin LktA family filamentous adhesin, partial [Pseudolabrys sp.]
MKARGLVNGCVAAGQRRPRGFARRSPFASASATRLWVVDHLTMRIFAVAMTIVMVLCPALGFAQSVPAGTVNIVPDGRTATTVTTNGSVSTVTTSTVSGPNAFNSFSQFQIGRGATGNLILPNGTSNLINLINGNDPAVINGVLNSYKNGEIGGNVYFAAPGGFVVGSHGVVNVGALNVTTPTREFVDSVVSRNGQINQGAVDNLLAGTVPLSPNGNIRIRGRVNAVDAVRLTGQNVFVGQRDAANAAHAAKFASTVNSKGLRSANGIVVRNGSIQIVAADSAKINGRMTARKGGTISVSAKNDVRIGAKANISANSNNGPGGTVLVTGRDIVVAGYGTLSAKSVNGDAGTVRIIADRSLVVEPNALFDVSSAQANAGIVELSSYGTFNLQNGFTVNGSAPNGRAGTLITDPPDVVVGDPNSDSGVTLSNSDIVAAVNSTSAGMTYLIPAGNEFLLAANGVIRGQRSDGTTVNIKIAATKSITIDGIIDTRAYSGALVTTTLADASKFSTGSSGSVTLESQKITISAGGKVLADVNNATGAGATSYAGGDITLTAVHTDHQAQLASNADAEISIAGALAGRNITATAKADASTNFQNSALGMAQFAAGFLLGALAGINGGYVKSEATAKVTLEDGADIRATGALTLAAQGWVEAKDPAVTFSLSALQNAVAAGAVVGIANAYVQTRVKSGAKISAGDLVVLAENHTNLDISSLVISGQTAADASLAYSTGTVNTRALIDPGAIINKVSNVTVAAQNQNSFSTSATALSAGTGRAAFAVAISDVTNNAVANLGATIAQSAGAGAITVYSGNNTTKNSVSSSSTVGSPFLLQGIEVVTQTGGLGTLFAQGGVLDSTKFFDVMQSQGTTAASRFGMTLALNMPTLTSSASIAQIAPNAQDEMAVAGTLPTIVGSGNVGVISILTDSGVRGNASASIESNAVGTEADPTTKKGVAMAAAVTQITESSNAYVGSGVRLTGAHIGVSAETKLPITNTWLDFATFKDVTTEISDLMSHANGNLGIVNNILTTYANATADTQTFGFSGAVNYFSVTNNTVAWVGSGAVLNTTGTACAVTSNCWTSTPTLSTPSPSSFDLTGSGAPATFNWNHDVEVQATSTTQSINIGGNFSWLLLFATNTSKPETPDQPPGNAIGGSANVNIFGTNTIAGIGAGATVTTAGTLEVQANTHDLVYAVAPTAGKGSGLGLNGIASVLQFDNNTSASISNSAKVTAASVDVGAEQHISTFDVAGAVGYSKGLGIGLGLALASVDTSTSAFIGDNSSALSGTGLTADDRNFTPIGAGFVDALNVSVEALSVGRLTTVVVAAQGNNNTPDPAAAADVKATDPEPDGLLSAIGQFFKGRGTAIVAKITGAYNGIAKKNTNKVQGGNSTAGAGSAAIDLTNVDTVASIANATLKYGTGGNNTVSVQALNNTVIDTASGSAALSKGAPGTKNTVGIAGAVAVTLSSDMTSASITQSTITAKDVTVQALAGGESTTLGLAVALTTSQSSSTQVSASVSIAQIDNGVQANVDSSTIGQATGNTAGDLTIIADQKTNIAIGAGSLYAGFGGGASNGGGVAFTLAEIGDPSGGAAVSAVLSNSKVFNTRNLTVEALDTSRIAAGAAVAGGGADSNGFSGSVIVNDINPTILAEITSVPAVVGRAPVSGGITVSGDVNVISTSGFISALDAIIANAAMSSNGGLVARNDSGVDFSAGDLSPTSATGAAIIAVAGNVQLGKANVGVSILVNRIGTSHLALIDRASVTSTGGVVNVSALDSAEIIGVAIGIGGATGSVAGNGSVVYNAINNAVVAQIGHGDDANDIAGVATATVDAAAVQVTALDTAKIRGAAGAISINIGGGNAVGVSAVVDQIETFVSAGIVGATVTADNALGNASSLINSTLPIGAVRVYGSSDADIISVAVGAAVSRGNAPQSAQQNLSRIVGLLRPTAPTALKGFGAGGAVATPTPPGTPVAPEVPASDGISGSASIVISTESTSVYSGITKGGNNAGSSVTANSSVVVGAANADDISAYAGAISISINSGKGLGASVVVNTINGTTSAGISDSTVNAHGGGGTANIDDSTLANAVDPAHDYTPASNPDLSNGTTTIKGVAVYAASRQTADTVAAVLSASNQGTAIAANTITNVMGGTTQATILSSNINKNLRSGEISAVRVGASSASYANNLDVGAAGSSQGAAGTIVLVINTMNRTTTAKIDTSDIGSSSVSAGQVTVLANALQGTTGIAVGAALSGNSAAGTGSSLVNLFQSTTTASLDHGTVYANALSVTADGNNGFFAAVGSGAIGSSAGIGATVLVTTSNNTVRALVGDADPSSAATALHLSGAVNVSASNKTSTESYAIVGSFGGTMGIAAQFSGIIVTNDVEAELTNTSVTTSGNVTVSATETDSLNPVVGGIAGGGSAGIGAAVNLVILKSNTRALMAGATVTTTGNVTVSALSTRDVSPITAIAGLGGSVGIAGTVGVVLIGSGATSDQMSVLNSQAQTDDPNVPSGGTLDNAGRATGTNVVAATGSGVDGISAQIIGGSVTANKVDVNAKAETSVLNIVGALAVGLGGGGFGAAVAFTDVDQKVTAKAVQGSLTAPTVSVTATAGDHGSGHAAESWGIAGAGGLYAGLGAAVGKAIINNTITAELGSTTDGDTNGATSGVLAVNASDTSRVSTYGYGFGVGAAAVGLSLGFSQKSSTVTADIAASTTVSRFSDVSVKASGSGSVYSHTIAGAGGIVSGAGSSANATDSETISAEIGSNASVSAAGPNGILVDARATPNVSVESEGVSAGAVGIGASVALATASATVTADVGNDATLSGGKLKIAAYVFVPTGGHSASALAIGAGGGFLLGVQATNAQANNTSSATAYGGTGLHLPSNDVTILSETDTDQYAKGTGIAAGYVGAGATVANTTSNTHSIAYLDSGAITASNNLGILTITASGNDSNKADALAGSGGVVAGAAAVATTSATAETSATLKDAASSDTLYFGGFGVGAAHTATYEANGDGFQASAVGAAGAGANNSVTSTTTAVVGSNYIINSAAGDMKVIASDTVNQLYGGARAGSGGVAAGAATVSDATVRQTVTAHVKGNTIFSLNDNPYTSLAAIDIEALTFLSTKDSVRLDAGGLFAGGGARSPIDAHAHNIVQIDDGVTLFSAGNLYVGSAAIMKASNNANAKLYGLLTGAGASTNSALKATQDVTIGNAKLEAWGLLNVYAGQSGNGYYLSDLSANGTTIVYNYALIPITATYKGQSSAESHSTLTLGTGSRIYGANNVFIGADPGNVASNGNGTSYNPYLSLFSKEDHDNAGATPVKSGDVILNGVIEAGIHNQANITINYDGVVSMTTGPSTASPLALEFVSDPNNLNPVMSYNHQKVQYSIVAGFNAHDDAINTIASMSGLTSTQVEAAVAAHQQITAQNDDASGTKQRQINTLIQQLPYLNDAGGPAYKFGNILASAGNVSILATTLTTTGGTPSITARDSAKITFDNQGIKFLFLSDLAVSATTGGRLNFTGQATDTNSTGIAFTRDLTNQVPSIIINASWSATNVNRQPIDSNGVVLTTTPDIYFGGNVVNYNGLLNVTNQLGNVLITRDMRVGTVVMNVPNGMIGGSLGANSVYNSNYDVSSQWNDVEYGPTNILQAVSAAATYLGYTAYATGGAYIDGDPTKTPYYYYTGEGHVSPIYDPVTNYTAGTDRNTIFTARLLSLFYGGGGSLYSAIFLPIATTGAMSGSPAGSTFAGWQNSWYKGQVYWDGDSGPFNCSGCGTYFQLINIQNQMLTGVTAPSSSVTPQPSLITAGKALILSAAVININGDISVGQSSDYSVKLDTNAQSRINWFRNDADRLAAAKADASAGKYIDLTDYVSSVNGSDIKITAKYNAVTDQILLDPVVQGTGGFVYLNGKIISTSPTGNPMGNITVHGGAGTVKVQNLTDTALVTNVINTGVSAASVIEFVDQSKNLTTWYVYNAGAPANQQVSIYQQAGVNNGSYNALTPVSVTANSGLAYTPAAQLYQWVDTLNLSRPDISDMTQFGWQLAPGSSNPNSSLGGWVRSQPQVIAGSQATNFSETLSASGVSHTYAVGTGNADFGTDFKNGTWYQQRYYQLTLTATNRVKADFPIGISFTGGGTSNIDITSTASIVVNNHINNLQGNTTLTATGTTNGAASSITAGADAFVSGVSVTMSAPGGIGTLANGNGTKTKAIPVATFGGLLTASSIDHDIVIAATGPVRIGSIKAIGANPSQPLGSVYLTASGDITQSSMFDPANPTVTGKNITINTTGGAIGAVSGVDQNNIAILTDINPLVIQAMATSLGNGTYDGGLLNSTSSTGTYIIQSSGDLRLGTVSSTSGPVFLAAMGMNGQPASILNGITTGGLTKEQIDHLKSVQTDLDLLGTSATNGSGTGAPSSVVTFQNLINSAYRDYWQLRNLAFYDGATYSATTAATTLDPAAIKSQLAIRLNVPVSAVTDPQVQAEIAVRSDAIKAQMAAKLHIQVADITDAQFNAEVTNRDLGRKVIATQIAAKTGADVATITDQQVQTEATNRYNKDQYLLGLKTVAQLNTTLDNLFGTSAGQAAQLRQAVSTTTLTTALTTFDANFSYALPTTSTVYTELASGARWTQDQLTYIVSNNADNSGAVPPIDSLPLNISGRQVMLYAPHGNIGNLAQPTTFSFTSDGSQPLNSLQKAMMAAAGPGQLAVTSTTTNGVTRYDVSIAQRSLVMVSPLGTVSAKALSQIYLGSASDMLLGGIPISIYGPIQAAYSAGIQTINAGEVLLQAVQSIKGGVVGQVAISGPISALTLISDKGSIGTADPDSTRDPKDNDYALLVSLTNNGLPVAKIDQAQALHGIYIRQVSGDLMLGNINAGSAADSALQLAATGSIYALPQFTDRTAVHLSATTLDLRAGGDVGFDGATFQPLQVKITGAVTGYAGGKLSLISPNASMTVGRTGNFGTLSSGGVMSLVVAAGDLTINASVTSPPVLRATIGAPAVPAAKITALLTSICSALPVTLALMVRSPAATTSDITPPDDNVPKLPV